uniref:Uncharacterized protein n=1 Tax=Arundo donax TaxID=35708 RepID=A0A0A9BVC2_ARUDO
MQAPKEMTK